MEIIQYKPRLVVSIENKIYKFFESKVECKNDLNRIKNSPISEVKDEKSNYKMKFVKILESGDYFYSMEKINGKCLDFKSEIENFALAGLWLDCFHKITFRDNKVFLYGDFIAGHLFIDHESKEIIAIDPGTSFGEIGEIEVDISRFLVNILSTRNTQIRKLDRIINKFIYGYGADKISFSKLDQHIKERVFKNFKKTLNHNIGFKSYFKAYFNLVFSKIKYRLIKKKLKNRINLL
tara:strand:+ start:1606 stop:2313 length:708 start_codon:yes stop_codon:yes gene_type:complete